MKSKLPSAGSKRSTLNAVRRKGRLRPCGGLGLISLLAVLAFGCQADSSTSAEEPASEAPTSGVEAEIQEVTATVETPSAGWDLELLSAHRVEDSYWVVFRLVPPPGMAAQVISEVSESARFAGPDLPVRKFVLGKTWNWSSDSDVEFIASLNEIKDELVDAQTLTLIPVNNAPPPSSSF